MKPFKRFINDERAGSGANPILYFVALPVMLLIISIAFDLYYRVLAEKAAQNIIDVAVKRVASEASDHYCMITTEDVEKGVQVLKESYTSYNYSITNLDDVFVYTDPDLTIEQQPSSQIGLVTFKAYYRNDNLFQKIFMKSEDGLKYSFVVTSTAQCQGYTPSETICTLTCETGYSLDESSCTCVLDVVPGQQCTAYSDWACTTEAQTVVTNTIPKSCDDLKANASTYHEASDSYTDTCYELTGAATSTSTSQTVQNTDANWCDGKTVAATAANGYAKSVTCTSVRGSAASTTTKTTSTTCEKSMGTQMYVRKLKTDVYLEITIPKILNGTTNVDYTNVVNTLTLAARDENTIIRSQRPAYYAAVKAKNAWLASGWTVTRSGSTVIAKRKYTVAIPTYYTAAMQDICENQGYANAQYLWCGTTQAKLYKGKNFSCNISNSTFSGLLTNDVKKYAAKWSTDIFSDSVFRQMYASRSTKLSSPSSDHKYSYSFKNFLVNESYYGKWPDETVYATEVSTDYTYSSTYAIYGGMTGTVVSYSSTTTTVVSYYWTHTLTTNTMTSWNRDAKTCTKTCVSYD